MYSLLMDYPPPQAPTEREYLNLIADILSDLLQSIAMSYIFRRPPKAIPALQDYLVYYLFRRIDPVIKAKIWSDQVLSQVVWQQMAGYPTNIFSLHHLSHSFLLSEGKLESKYVATKDSIFGFLIGREEHWWEYISPEWMQNMRRHLKPFLENRWRHHLEKRRTKRLLASLSLVDDVRNLILYYLYPAPFIRIDV